MNDTIVVNLETSGHWKYTDFNFNSLVRFNDNYYIANDNGIFKIEQPAQHDVVGEIQTGRLPFDEVQAIYLHDLYADCRGEMDLEITTITNEETRVDYEFSVRPENTGKHSKRFKLARGVSGNSWELVIRNIQGSNFDMANINPVPKQSQRSR